MVTHSTSNGRVRGTGTIGTMHGVHVSRDTRASDRTNGCHRAQSHLRSMRTGDFSNTLPTCFAIRSRYCRNVTTHPLSLHLNVDGSSKRPIFGLRVGTLRSMHSRLTGSFTSVVRAKLRSRITIIVNRFGNWSFAFVVGPTFCV